MNQQKPVKIMTVKQVQKLCDNISASYHQYDSSPQSIYYNMPKAKNVLEVGCGRCLLVPYCLELINQQATYLATDLSPKMVQLAKAKVQQSLKKYDSKLTFQEWCQKHHMAIKAANGEQIIQTNIKFDRIICNMVLMLTQNPQKMLKSLYQQAQQGCLLGVSVWGNKQLALILDQLQNILTQLKVQRPNIRSNFFLYNKVTEIAGPIGWKLCATWQQVGVFPYLYISDLQAYMSKSISKMSYLSQQQKKYVLTQYIKRQSVRIVEKKQALTIPSQIYIFKK